MRTLPEDCYEGEPDSADEPVRLDTADIAGCCPSPEDADWHAAHCDHGDWPTEAEVADFERELREGGIR